MGMYNRQFWYSCKMMGAARASYIVSAFDIMEAERFLRGRNEGSNITCLTWKKLSDLTGCMMPSGAIWSELASGNIMFDREGKIAILVIDR